MQKISIHAPRAGRDGERPFLGRYEPVFQSTRPVRGATWRNKKGQPKAQFQSTRPVRGATAKVYKITLHTFATKGNS